MPVAFSNSTGTLTAVTSAADIAGVFAGCEYSPVGLRRIYSPYWPAAATYDASQPMYAYFWSDPEIRYAVQADGSVALAGTPAAIGAESDLTNWTNGSVYTGGSQLTLASALKASGAQGMFRIVDLYQDPSNAWGDAFVILRVMNAQSQQVSNKVAI
jgi:hypothetical protein